MQPERVVAPDDIAQDLVVAAVVRCIDDPLVLPPRPRVRAGRAEQEPVLARKRLELRAPLAHHRGGGAEVVALPGADLCFRRDQLADEMRLELASTRRRL